jgi:hypothetical protein
MCFCKFLFILACYLPFEVYGSPSSSWRDYSEEVTDQEKENIAYIVKTLGNKSLPKIYREKEALKKAGDKIDHVHPLRFLMTIFTNEELKAAICNIRESRWVWGEFKKGLFNSLKDESKNKNMNDEYIQHFATTVHINPALINPPINRSDWDGLISTLIKNVPREGNPNRYDM